MRNTRCIVTTALATVGTLTGCSNYQPPRFEAMGVREIERGPDHTVVSFTIQATNPNREPMPLGQTTYSVWIGGQELFSGVQSPEATVHTYATHLFELPAVLPASALSGAGELPYEIRGKVIYQQPGALADVLFDAQLVVPEANLDLAGTVKTGG